MENINDVKNRIKNKSNKSIKKNEKVVKPNKFKQIWLSNSSSKY